MNVRDWIPIASTRIPSSVERRWCPTSEFHWKTDDERCPVCKAKIRTSHYALVDAKRKMRGA